MPGDSGRIRQEFGKTALPKTMHIIIGRLAGSPHYLDNRVAPLEWSGREDSCIRVGALLGTLPEGSFAQVGSDGGVVYRRRHRPAEQFHVDHETPPSNPHDPADRSGQRAFHHLNQLALVDQRVRTGIG